MGSMVSNRKPGGWRSASSRKHHSNTLLTYLVQDTLCVVVQMSGYVAAVFTEASYIHIGLAIRWQGANEGAAP